MPEIASTAHDMISGMKPEAKRGLFVFVTTSDAALIAELSSDVVGTFREKEGMSLLVPVDIAQKQGFNVDHPMRCITLSVYSSLEGVGLTAAVATALGEASIPCNMVAAFHHDHVFVPSNMCDAAMEVLQRLQEQAIKPA
jgi:hypothetical protein